MPVWSPARSRWSRRRKRRRSGSAAARRFPPARPTCTSRPSLKTATRSAMESASPWSCVTNTKVRPSRRCSPFSSPCISSRSFRSSAPSGSSSSSTFGRTTKARASATRCRWPPEKLRGLALFHAGKLDQRQRLAPELLALGPADAAHRQPVADVGEHVHCAGRGHSPGRRCSPAAGRQRRLPPARRRWRWRLRSAARSRR